MKKIVLIVGIIILIISCKKSDAPACADCMVFYFENPQPEKDSELDHFPNKFRGLYLNVDSTFIRIDEDRIMKEYLVKFKIHKLKLDSTKTEYKIINGKLITNDTKEKYDIKEIGDSIELIKKDIDTIFRFSLNQKVKRIDGQLILSTRDSVLWNVQVVSLEKNTIKFKNFYEGKDLKKLDSVTKIKGKMLDSLSYLIKPSRSELKKILKIKDLGYTSEYRKLSK